MSRPFRCSERPTAMKPTARTTIAMIAQITTCAVSHIRRLRGVATNALLGWSLSQARSTRQQERSADGVIDHLIENGALYAASFRDSELTARSRLPVAVVRCMDARAPPELHQA